MGKHLKWKQKKKLEKDMVGKIIAVNGKILKLIDIRTWLRCIATDDPRQTLKLWWG